MRFYLSIALFALVATTCQATPWFWSSASKDVESVVGPVVNPVLDAVDPVLDTVEPVVQEVEEVVEDNEPGFFCKVISFITNIFSSKKEPAIVAQPEPPTTAVPLPTTTSAPEEAETTEAPVSEVAVTSEASEEIVESSGDAVIPEA